MALTTESTPVNPPEPPTQATDCNAVKAYNWNVQVAYAICMAESGGIASRDNAGLNSDGSTDYGLMQINSIHADLVGGNLEALRNPDINIKVAYELYQARGNFTAWSTYNNGRYAKWL